MVDAVRLTNAKTPEQIVNALLQDGVELGEMLSKHGFGDVAFRRSLFQFEQQCRAKLGKIREMASSPKPEDPSSKPSSPRGPVMILDEETGEQREATPEDLERLQKEGAPVGPAPRAPRLDDDEENDIEVVV